jgi:hypothetical protein
MGERKEGTTSESHEWTFFGNTSSLGQPGDFCKACHWDLGLTGCDLRDILALQSDVARAVAKEISIQVTPQENRKLTWVVLGRGRPI